VQRKHGAFRLAGHPRERPRSTSIQWNKRVGISQTSTDALEGWWERMVVVLTVDWIMRILTDAT
jgi:hypothetical protein